MDIIDLLFHKQFSSSWRSAYFCFGLSSQLSSWWLIVSPIPDVFQAECRFKMILTEYKKIRAGAHWYAEEDSSGQLSSEASVRQKERDLEVKKEKNIYYGWYGLIVVFFPSSPPNRLPALVTSGDAFAFFSGRPLRVFFLKQCHWSEHWYKSWEETATKITRLFPFLQSAGPRPWSVHHIQNDDQGSKYTFKFHHCIGINSIWNC